MFPSSDSTDGGGASARLPSSPSRLASSVASSNRLDPVAVLGLLSHRDRAIVDLLDDHEVLTTGQLARLFFSRLDVAQRRLLRLTKLRVLDRFRWQLLHGSESFNYVLGPIGAQLAAAARDVDPPTPAAVRQRTIRIARRPQLDHLLGLNGWFCDLAVEARSRDARLAQWWGERRCAERFGSIVRPDAAATYVEGNRRLDFFFEYDVGTETIGRVSAKLARYHDLVVAGGPAVPVLIWCPSAVRAHHLLDAITGERRAGLAPGVPVALASAEGAVALGAGPTGACWAVPGEVPRRRLIDLASNDGDSTSAIDGELDAQPAWEL